VPVDDGDLWCVQRVCQYVKVADFLGFLNREGRMKTRISRQHGIWKIKKIKDLLGKIRLG